MSDLIERVTVTITADLARLVRDAISNGEYASTSEIVRDALRKWARDREDRALRRRDFGAAGKGSSDKS